MFRFVVCHLRWLARVPGLPQYFDTMLLTWTALFHRRRLRAMEAIEEATLQMPGVRLCVHRLGGMEFVCGERELGHLHGNGLLDVRVGMDEARVIVRDGLAGPHHVFGESAWVSFWVRGMEDVQGAVELLEKARDANSS